MRRDGAKKQLSAERVPEHHTHSLAAIRCGRWRPRLDRIWESHPAHFWIVLTTAAASVALGSAVSTAGGRGRDARLFLISLTCLSSAGFLGLHALATPGVLLGKNAGFELARPSRSRRTAWTVWVRRTA